VEPLYKTASINAGNLKNQHIRPILIIFGAKNHEHSDFSQSLLHKAEQLRTGYLFGTVTDFGFFFLTRTQRFIAKQWLCHFSHWAGFLPAVEMTPKIRQS
jgi:hypothetical protein